MTHEEIVEQARVARFSLLQTIEGIETEIKQIKDKEWVNPLSKTDRDKLKQLRADKADVMLAVEELGYVTMRALDSTDGIRRINNALTSTRRDLAAERTRLERFAESPQKFADALAQLKTVADKVAEKLSG